METDVLVVGGGIAGCFAAIKAKEQGLDVIQIDKGYVGKSGQTPYAGSWALFNSEWGDDLEAWMGQVKRIGEYVNHRNWTEIGFRDSYARYLDLVSWGVTFREYVDGGLMRVAPPWGPCKAALFPAFETAKLIRKQVKKTGVRIVDRMMITELIKQDGEIIGALGIPVDKEASVVVKAKAVVLCTGAGGFKAAGWPISGLTSDGDAMAYRVGATITGKEFVDPHLTNAETPSKIFVPKGPPALKRNEKPPGPPGGPRTNAEGELVESIGTLWLDNEFQIHAGKGPITMETPDGKKAKMVGGAASGMSTHKTEGIWSVGVDCFSGIPGLYAAGDALGTMQSGATYAAIGVAISGSAVTGAIAGKSAAAYAKQKGGTDIGKESVMPLEKTLFEPLYRKGGFSPRWVTQMLQNAMIPYYVMYIKKEDRLLAALTNIEFMRDHLVPQLVANDAHELRLAIETKNMVLNAEMRLRASLFRKESRGCHYREDYPFRDDENFLAWVLLKEKDGEMIAFKKDIPESWKPDQQLSYVERYPNRILSEKILK
jgi:succinate dehydrogenase/fumarate reductase flavoprotein subunit